MVSRHVDACSWIGYPGWIVLVFLVACVPAGAGSPYPASPVIEKIEWDWSSAVQTAPGSDQWPVTWGADGNLYATWGDGSGFPGGLGDSSWGVARIMGTPPNWSGQDLYGKPRSSPDAGKAPGLLCVDRVIYVWLQKQDNWKNTRIVKSVDNGQTWTLGPYILEYPLNRFTPIQFGQNYQGGRDNYVYGYCDPTAGEKATVLDLARVPKTGIENRPSYQVFAGFDGNGNPTWSNNLADRKPVFTDPTGVNWGQQAVYHPVLKRYLLTVSHGGPNGEGPGLGIFDAPEPWGPWSTVHYTDAWKDNNSKFCFSFPQKWMSADGKSGWMIHSGWPEYDNYNHLHYTLTLKPTPDADAGPDGTAYESHLCQLDGSGSTDVDTWFWTQLAGKPVTLQNAGTATPYFTAPKTASKAEAQLTFHLGVANSVGSDSDDVNIRLRLLGDANGDDCADSADLALWQRNYKPLGLSESLPLLQVAASEQWVPYVPLPEQTDISVSSDKGVTTSEVLLTFPDTGYRVTDWGPVLRQGDDFSANAQVEDWTGAAALVITPILHDYDLGQLAPGGYTFTFKVWGHPVETMPFAVMALPAGDGNGDAAVDSADLGIWQQHYDPLGKNQNTPAMGNWDGDNDIDSADLALWQRHYNPLGQLSMSSSDVQPSMVDVLALTELAVPLGV